MQMSKVNREKGYCYYSNVEELRKRISFALLFFFFLLEGRNIIPSIFSNLGPGRDERNHSHPQCFSFKNAVGLWERDEKECAVCADGSNKLIRSISSIFGSGRALCVRCFMRSKPTRYVYLYKKDTNCIFQASF